jgi:anti-sigma regulatory factor (Ser/Thr protein kinase)
VGTPPLHVELEAVPENLSVARHALRGWLQHAGYGAEAALDIELAAGEAVANVVRHAYPADAGPVELQAAADEAGVRIGVRDRGCGAPALPGPRGGLGLPLMQSLAQEVRVSRRPGRGTEVELRFSAPPDRR